MGITVDCELGEDSETLGVALESGRDTRAGDKLVEDMLGKVTEWRVSEVMCERRRFDDVRVEPATPLNAVLGFLAPVCQQAFDDTPRNLGDFEGMGQSAVRRLPLTWRNDLRDSAKPPEGRAVQDAVAVMPKLRSAVRILANDLAAVPVGSLWSRGLQGQLAGLSVSSNCSVNSILWPRKRCQIAPRTDDEDSASWPRTARIRSSGAIAVVGFFWR